VKAPGRAELKAGLGQECALLPRVCALGSGSAWLVEIVYINFDLNLGIDRGDNCPFSIFQSVF
jgi:hypothetical protein